MSQQQTVLRVLTNIPGEISGTTQYDFLDLYSDVPIKINKSISEIEDIAKKNSDYSIGLTLPGSKKNNKFFENFFNVDAQSLYFNANQRVNCDVLLNDQSFFKGYLRLNKVSVLNSKVEYDVTLYSTVGELFGLIGNNLLKDLDFTDSEYTFNHTFSLAQVVSGYTRTIFDLNQENPTPYFYPIVHNGYEYSGNTVLYTGSTSGSTRFYTSTSPISGYTSKAQAETAGATLFTINSPLSIDWGTGLIDNQLKPGLNIWNLFKLIFKTYGYTIKSDFFNTPWFKGLYMYGYFSSELTKFGYKITNIQQLPLDGVKVFNSGNSAIVVKGDTGIPCYASEDINVTITWLPSMGPAYNEYGVIKAGSSGYTYNGIGTLDFFTASVPESYNLNYYPKAVGTTQTYVDGDYVSFSLVVDQNIKQIDLLSSIAKKFDLVFIPDPEVPNQLMIEPYDYYIGTGQIYDWTPKLSYDKGFTVQPALNNIESNLILTDLEDQDEGNRIFKNQNNRIYGQNYVYNPTDFKSQEKKIETIFSSELIRKWDKDGVDNINVPLGINYAASNNEAGTTNNSTVLWQYKGVKTKPKLIYWLGPFNPFSGTQGKSYDYNTNYSTYNIYTQASTGFTITNKRSLPVISHTMPMGLSDEQKINNDSFCILFNSELPANIGVQTYNTYTNNDVYNSFYGRRIGNLYNANTRFVDGYFDLKYSDIQNLKWNDLIKVNEQYFIVNKIEGYNLTNRELTKVQLIQYNTQPQEYPTRYFTYYYCDGSGCYKFKTDFTQPKLRDTNFNWSVWYDYNCGILGGVNTGFTSSISYDAGGFTYYVPFRIEEISQSVYESVSNTCSDWTCDTLHNYIYSGNTQPFGAHILPFWINGSSTKTGLNLFTSCTQFTTIATGNSINVGSSTHFGYNSCVPTPTPTPTPTITPTPTVTPTPTPIPCSFIADGYSGSSQVEYFKIQQSTGKIYTSFVYGNWWRLNSNGTIDSSFNGGSNTGSGSPFYDSGAFQITSSGGLLFAINPLRSWHGVSGYKGALLVDNTGAPDSSFNIGTGFYSTYGYSPPVSVNIDSTGKFIFSGQFTSYNSETTYYLVKTLSNGTIDTGFTNNIIYVAGNDKYIHSKVLSTDKIILWGTGVKIGTYASQFLRINSDGSADTTFCTNAGTGFNVRPQFVYEQADGKLIVTGPFSSYNGTSIPYGICRLNSNGTLDTTFNTNVGTGLNSYNSTYSYPQVVEDTVNSKIYVSTGHNTNTYNGTTVKSLFRINSNGTLDNTFNVTLPANYAANNVKLTPDNKILVSGNYFDVEGYSATYFQLFTNTGNNETCPFP